MQTTSNYRLKKPEHTDFYNVEDFNENADIIDKQLKKQSAATGISVDDNFNIGFGNAQEIIDIIAQKVVEGLLTKEDIVNHLFSEETDLPLSANQGRILAGRLDDLSFKVLTQSEYDALATKDENTIYFTTD